jgi:hypothetical protein
MDDISLEQTSTTNLEETPIRTNLPSIDGVKILVDKLDDTNFQKKK